MPLSCLELQIDGGCMNKKAKEYVLLGTLGSNQVLDAYSFVPEEVGCNHFLYRNGKI